MYIYMYPNSGTCVTETNPNFFKKNHGSLEALHILKQ